MTDVVSTPRPRRSTSSSGGISAHSAMERRASQETDEGPNSAGSAGSRASRKRVTSIDIEEANTSKVRNLSLETRPMSSQSGKDTICLCTPGLKIPRPRNPFILYRQHHQATVSSEFPGLSNPDISKIIGQRWKSQDPREKEIWRQLGEEEKRRHAEDYPDYRYRPRRGRSRSQTGSSASTNPGRCPNCGGRFIATPRTPSTPAGTPTVAKPKMQPHHPSEARSGDSDHLRRALPGEKQPYQHQHNNLRDVEEGYEPMSPSPELKRRRINPSTGYYQAVPSSGPYTGHPLSRQPRSSVSMPPTPPIAGYGPLPGPSSLARPGYSNMAPPPPRPPHPANAGPSRGPGYDESLRLPPLQTQSSPPINRDNDISDRPSAHPMTGMGIANPRDRYAQSLEAMIMTIPFWSKLKVLQKISPTLAPPEPASPEIEIRGAVVAVEGADPRQLEQVGTAVHRSLLGLSEIDLKTWSEGPSTPLSGLSAEDDARMNDTASAGGSSRKSSHSQPNLHASELFSNYMESILKWHVKSREIIKHVSTKPTFASNPPPLTRRASEGEGVGSRHSSISVPSKTPVALLPAGFSLTLSDKYACTLPIYDCYAPIDHWQWVSTLWRGIIGPDLVIYVKSVTEEEITHAGAVEFRGHGVMVVRVAHNKPLDEKTERRISFELVEWIRGGSYQEGFGRG